MTWLGTFGYLNDLTKGGVGSGIKGHTTFRDEIRKFKKEMEEKDQIELIEIVKDITQHDGKVGELFHSWYSGMDMSMMDNALHQIFKLPKENCRKLGKKEIDLQLEPKNKLNFMKVYTANQVFLKNKYPTGKVKLYRGVDGKTRTKFLKNKFGDAVDISVRNASSWSLDRLVGERFAKKRDGGVILKAEIPIENIIAHYGLDIKNSYSSEFEAVVAGKKFSAEVIDFVDPGATEMTRKDRLNTLLYHMYPMDEEEQEIFKTDRITGEQAAFILNNLENLKEEDHHQFRILLTELLEPEYQKKVHYMSDTLPDVGQYRKDIEFGKLEDLRKIFKKKTPEDSYVLFGYPHDSAEEVALEKL